MRGSGIQKQITIGLLGVALALVAADGQAVTVDLTPGAGSSGTINGALFEFDDQQPFGTGFVQSFLRIQVANPGSEQGYNTSNSSLPFDEVPPAGVFTRDLPFSELVATDGNYLFALDINEAGGGANPLLSLDALQIYLSSTASQNTTILSSLGTLVYDLDAGGDSTVLMDYDNAAGSGISDMLMTLPGSVFAGASPGDFVILYSRFGDTESAGDGFEEWAHVIPEPGTLALLGLGLVGLAAQRRTSAL